MNESMPLPDNHIEEPAKIEKREAVKMPEGALSEMRESLIARKSQAAASYAGLFMEGKITSKEAAEAIENIPERNKLVDRAFNYLEKSGVVQRALNPEKKGESIVVDLEKLVALKQVDLQKLGPIFFHSAYGKKNKADTLFEVFAGKKVLSREQLSDKDYKEKPLFYIPENREDALSPEKIRDAEFQTFIWDIVKANSILREHPVKEGEGLNWFETKMAAVIYHPSRGEGYRDQKGDLLIRDAKTRDFRKISTETIKDYGFAPSTLMKGRNTR